MLLITVDDLSIIATNGMYAKYYPSSGFLPSVVSAAFSQEIGGLALRTVVLMGSDEEDEFL